MGCRDQAKQGKGPWLRGPGLANLQHQEGWPRSVQRRMQRQDMVSSPGQRTGRQHEGQLSESGQGLYSQEEELEK